MSITAEDVKTALAAVIDPNTQKDLVSSKSVKNIKIDSADQLEEFMQSRGEIASHYKLSNQRSIADLDTTHFLYQLLERPASQKFRPWVLYWLASVEKNYRLSMFDMSAENFLTECIEKYSTDKAAKKCLASYKEMQEQSFTGSRGTELPKDIVKKISKYEALVNGKNN